MNEEAIRELFHTVKVEKKLSTVNAMCSTTPLGSFDGVGKSLNVKCTHKI